MKQINRILYEEMRPQVGRIILIILLLLLLVGFETLSPWSFKLLIDNVLGNQDLDLTGVAGALLGFINSKAALGFLAILIYFVSGFFATITEFFIQSITKNLGRIIITSFSQKAFNNLEGLTIGFYKKQEIGDYIYRLSYDVEAFGQIVEEGILPLLSNFLYLIVTITILFWINHNLAWFALSLLPVLAITLGIFNKRIGDASKRSERSNSALFSFIEEVLSQLRIIQAFGREKQESAVFAQREQFSQDDEYNMFGLGFLMNLLIGIVIVIGYSLIILYGITLSLNGVITTGLLVVFILYMDNLTQPLLSFVTAATAIRENHVRISRMNDFFDVKFHLKTRGNIARVEKGEIEFKKVSVKSEEGKYIVKDLSFKIPGGKKTVIVGVNGSGKTTVANLILNFLTPTSGKILIDGKDIRNYSILSLREAIAYVPQEIVLFDATIKDNIAFGKKRSSLEEIGAAAKLATADTFIHKLPKKLDFRVGEEGLNLSGGQRQRVMLARAFLRTSAKIVILDEPISALDVKTRAILMKNLDVFGKDKTTIFISNILEIINQADHIILLNEGRIIQDGSVKSLAKHADVTSLLINNA
ncbi:MAG: ABC transporter ATP-binding protein [Candidatus Doudnabacteria bacterium]